MVSALFVCVSIFLALMQVHADWMVLYTGVTTYPLRHLFSYNTTRLYDPASLRELPPKTGQVVKVKKT
jgi:hypothetical protein